jgi:predicted transcriptional regulator of viral defense system
MTNGEKSSATRMHTMRRTLSGKGGTIRPSFGRGKLTYSKSFPRTTQLKSSFVRVTEIGETFLDMLEHPERCGGMPHVLDVFAKHAATYLTPIVKRIDQADAKLTKVRAGYIINEMLGLKNQTAESWVRFAQRGGSQRLDPKAPYKPQFSENWMISLNV